jgi:uncharacterized protein (DUF2267 family)
MKDDEFMEAVAERAAVSPDRVAVLVAATLTTLADRLTVDEAHDLASGLPRALRAPLRDRDAGAAEPFGLDEFVRRLGDRAGVDPQRARTGARAVLATVHEAIGGGECHDVLARLPPEFRDLVETVPERARMAPG